MSFAWVFTTATFAGARVAPAVRAVLHGDPDGPSEEVRRTISRLVLGHHLGLLTEMGVLVIQFALILRA